VNLIEQQMPYRRGRILAILAQSNRSGSSVQLLRTTLNGWGYKADPDTVDIDIAWLERHGLIQRREVAGVTMLTITARGQAVVSGDLDFPGVQLIEG
jgi:repressor of nif and glnA expression